MRSRHRAGALASCVTLCLALALAGCGGDGGDDGDPGNLRIAKAVLKGLFSNSVETTRAEPPPVAPAPAPEAMPVASFQEEAPATCEIPYKGPVTIIPVRSATALARSIAERPARELVYETEDTAIFEDGKVLTRDLENLGTHLNAVGWSTNPMTIAGAGVRPGGSSQSAWSAGESGQGSTTKKKRRRRG